MSIAFYKFDHKLSPVPYAEPVLDMSISSSTQDANVRSIVNSYRSIEILHPIVTSLYESPELKQMFWDTLKHDLHVIHQRSQNLADSEITVIQKAFKHLMDNEEDEIPAVELYVEEILGLRFVSDTEKLQTVASAVEAKDSILSRAFKTPQLVSQKALQLTPWTSSYRVT